MEDNVLKQLTAVQSQKAVYAYITSKQILHFGFAVQSREMIICLFI